MKKTAFILFFFTALIFSFKAEAQVEKQSQELQPEKYLQKTATDYQTLTIKVWDYTKNAKSAKTLSDIDDQRLKLISELEKAIKKLEGINDWKGELKLFTAFRSYYGTAITVLKLSYSELATLEKTKSNSLDQMKKFLQKEKSIRDQLLAENQKAIAAQDEFTKFHKIDINSDNTGVTDRMEKAGEVYDYYDQVYLLIYRCSLLDQKIMDAIAVKNTVEMDRLAKEQAVAANEGIGILNKMNPFTSQVGKAVTDDRLRKPTRQLLDFYKNTAEVHTPKQIAFFEAQQQFKKNAEALQANPKRTKEQVVNFNKEKNQMKKKTELYNRENGPVNAKRTFVVNVWNNDAVNFIEINVPE